MATRRIALSTIARDPVVAAFLARGERDTGPEPVLAKAPLPRLAGGPAVQPALDDRFAARALEDA